MRPKIWILRLKLRWLSWRIQRRTGDDNAALLDRADAARARARYRALLIDPADAAAAEDAGSQAAMDTYARECQERGRKGGLHR